MDLQDDEKTQNVSGEVEIWYQWRYNPLLDFEPFTDVESDKAPNVLRVGLSQGRGLAVMDKNLLSKGGSSDPRCVISFVDGDGAAPALCSCLRLARRRAPVRPKHDRGSEKARRT